MGRVARAVTIRKLLDDVSVSPVGCCQATPHESGLSEQTDAYYSSPISSGLPSHLHHGRSNFDMNMEPITTDAFSRTPPEKQTQPLPSPPPSKESWLCKRRMSSRRMSSTADQIWTTERRTYKTWGDETRPYWKSYSQNSILWIMPSGVHEAVRVGTEEIFSAQLRGFPVKSLGSESIKLYECSANAQQPDAQYGHSERLLPGMVIEIAHAQPTKHARKQTQNYIYGTYGEIPSGILISVKHPPEESIMSLFKATFSFEGDEKIMAVEEVFCKVIQATAACDCRTDVYQVFRASDGTKANEDAYLTIPLSDFGIDEAKNIEIGCGQIFDLVVAAEAKQKLKRKYVLEPATRRIRRQRLPSSSPEQLEANREGDFQREEGRAEATVDEQSDYETSFSESDICINDEDRISSRLRARPRRS